MHGFYMNLSNQNAFVSSFEKTNSSAGIGTDPTNTLWWIHRCWKWSPCRVFIACCRDPSRRVKYHVYVSMFASVQPYTRQVTSSSLACPHQWCICTVRKQIRIAKWGIGVSHLALKNVSGSVISRLRNPPYLAFLSESLFLVSANWLTNFGFSSHLQFSWQLPVNWKTVVMDMS